MPPRDFFKEFVIAEVTDRSQGLAHVRLLRSESRSTITGRWRRNQVAHGCGGPIVAFLVGEELRQLLGELGIASQPLRWVGILSYLNSLEVCSDDLV
jgi:hypothetical protein